MNDKEMIELTGMSIAELDTAVEVALSAEVDEYVKTIQWSDDTDQYTKTLIIGNIRGFALRTTSPKSPINHLLNRLSHDFATATAKIERLRGLLADVMESSLGMTQGAIGRVQSFQDAEAFLTTLEPKDGEL